MMNLKDKIVLVHPSLEYDPAGRQNQAGRIVSADLEHDDILVRFMDCGEGLYAADALLVLKEPAAMFEWLEASTKDLKDPLIRIVYGIAGTLHIGFGAADRQAMNRAIQDKSIREVCLENFREALDRGQSWGMER